MNGFVKRFNQTLCKILAKHSSKYKKDWDIYLPSALFAYRIMRQNTIWYEPFYFTYGWDAVLLIKLKISGFPILDQSDHDFEELYF